MTIDVFGGVFGTGSKTPGPDHFFDGDFPEPDQSDYLRQKVVWECSATAVYGRQITKAVRV